MKRKILEIILMAEEILSTNEKVDWNEQLKYFSRWIGYFQHERLIHLMVTCLFAILTILTIFINLFKFSIPSLILFVLFFILLIPYIGHYYLLENKTQYLYNLYDQMVIKSKNV